MKATFQREIDGLKRNCRSRLGRLGLAVHRSAGYGLGHHDRVHGAISGRANTRCIGRAGHCRGIDRHRIGLFAAIPAVLAYNRFTAQVDRLTLRYESFIDDFSNTLQAQSQSGTGAIMSRVSPFIHAPPSPQNQRTDERRALHRRDAGAAGDFHGGAPMIQTKVLNLPSVAKATAAQEPPLIVEMNAQGVLHLSDAKGAQQFTDTTQLIAQL